jgi:hypothetical protein
VVWVTWPPAAEIVTVYVPRLTECFVEIVSVEEAEVVAMVTGLVENAAALTPAGRLLALSVTGPVNPLIGVTVTVKVAVPPREMVRDEGVADSAKSVTVKFDVDLAVPPSVVTAIGPLAAPAGTVNESCVSKATEKETAVPFSVTPVAQVKPIPVTVTDVPTVPLAGENDEMVGGGGGATVKFEVEVAVPPGVVTAIGPVPAPLGTVAVICVADDTLNADAGVPANETEVAPLRPLPEIVTLVPTGPLDGLKEEIVGAGGGPGGGIGSGVAVAPLLGAGPRPKYE